MNSRVWIIILFCIIGFLTGISLADIPSMALENGHQSLITDFRADTVSGTAPVSVQFTDTSVGSPREWYWSFGDGSSDTVEHPLHLYTNPGIYSVSLRTTGTSGSDMKTRLGYIIISEPAVTQIETQANPIAPLIATPDQSSSSVIPSPSPVDVTSADSTPLPSESPTPVITVPPVSTPTLSEVSPIPTPSPSEDQSKQNLFNLLTHTVHANFTTSATTGLSPLVVQFTDNSSGNPDNWSWDFGDGTSSDLASPEHIFSVPGKYTVRLTVKGIDGSDTRVCDQLIEVTLPPEASIRAQPRNGSAPLVVAFTDTSIGRVNSWFWSFGDGTNSVEKNPVHTFTRAGVYDVSLTISGPDGGANIVMPGIVTVTEKIQAPAAKISVDSDAGEAPLTVRFTDSSAGDVTTRTWDFGDSERGAASELTHTYQKPGTYTTVLNIKGPAGESRAEQVISVHEPVSSLKAAFIADTLTGTAPLVISFTDSSSGNVSSWSWDFGDGTTSVEKNPVHTYPSAGSFSVRLTVSGSGGEDHLDMGVIVTEILSAPSGSFTVEPAEGVAPLDVSFNDTSSGNVSSWSWDFGDGTRSTDRNPTHTYPTSGYYQVVLLVEGSGGTGHAESSVVVKEPQSAPSGSFTAEPAEGVAPLDVSFKDTSSGTISFWSWDFGDGTRSSDQNPVHSFKASGSYQVVLSISGPGGQDSAQTKVIVHEPEAAPVAMMKTDSRDGTAPLTVSFSDGSTGTITSRNWNFGDGKTSTEQNPVHTYTSPGVYPAVIMVTGPGGDATDQVNITVRAEPQVTSTPTPEQTTAVKKQMVSRFTTSQNDGAAPLTVSFFDTSVGEITSWNWNFGDGTTSTEQNPSHTFTSAGNYPVSLTISGPEGERKSDLSMILVIASVTPPRALLLLHERAEARQRQ